MKKHTNKVLKIVPYIALFVLVGVTIVYASSTSSLTPPASVSNTMYSLTDIYNLASGTTANEGTGEIDVTPSEVSLSGKSLSDVYEALSSEIAKLTPSILLSGNTVFGVEGEAEEGVSEPTITWQTDPNLILCWSHNQLEIDNGCVVGSSGGFVQTPDTLNTLGAVEYCKYLNEDGVTLANTEQNIWHLPTIQEFNSITDYTKYGNATSVPGFVDNPDYWSSTQDAKQAVSAWGWYGRYGSTLSYYRFYKDAVRCAR